MSLDDASRIVSRLGPTTIALDRRREPQLARHLSRLGCIVRDPGEEASVGLCRFDGGEVAVPAGVETLVALAPDAERARVEGWLLDAGWSRHPAGFMTAEAAAWSPATLPRLSFYRRSAAPALLRRGPCADAALARFAIAADEVRPGDRVLVAGVDADAGRSIVAALSRAHAVAGSIATAEALAAHPPQTLDTIVLVADSDTIDEPLLDAAARALKLDGRIVVAWQGEGVAVEAALADRFIVDRRWHQADGGTLLLASADPFAPPAAPYRHPAFHRGEGPLSVLVDFAAAYENPHLYRTMVQLGERLGDEIVLARLAECVLEEAGRASADRGAAITVLGYRVLDLALADSIAGITALIDDYLAATDGSNAPHVLRWRLSLLFLAGRLAELAGEPMRAIERFRAASQADWTGFSPILATKAVAAAFHEARLHLAADDSLAAAQCFRHGLETALAAAGAPHGRLIGDPAAPVPFYLQELAEVIDMGGQCAVALNSLPLLDRDPGLFWRQVDAKRFGLFAWADGLQREQARLHG